MTKKISRRTFNASVVAAGLVTTTGAKSLLANGEKPDIVVAKGTDAVKNLKAALAEVGGIKAFVSPGQTVNLLTNTIGRYPGTYTAPELIKATAELCKEAGAKEVRWTDWRTLSRLKENKLIEATKDENLIFEHVENSDPSGWQTVDIPRGEYLKKVRVFKNINDADVYIAMPIIKHHSSANFTGALKLMMGVTNQEDNRNMFHRSGKLEECIADLNTATRKPDLYIMDAMQTILTGGPMGPGKPVKPEKVIVGFDPVALDTYASPLVNIVPAESVQIQRSAKLGIGETDLAKLKIKEITS